MGAKVRGTPGSPEIGYCFCPARQKSCQASLLRYPAHTRIQFWEQSCGTEWEPRFAALPGLLRSDTAFARPAKNLAKQAFCVIRRIRESNSGSKVVVLNGSQGSRHSRVSWNHQPYWSSREGLRLLAR